MKYRDANELNLDMSEAFNRALKYYYGPKIDEVHLSEHGAITNYSDGRMDFVIEETLLLGFGIIEYKVEIDPDTGASILYVQNVTEHYLER